MDQRNNPGVSANFLVKRRPGRPRKHPKLDHNHGTHDVHVPRPLHPSHGNGSPHAPPGYEKVNRSWLHQADDVTVGQPVVGVVEASFDAGYLLSVKVGNSGTTLRGVVFKPGRFAPVSADNDVAPDLQMISRKNVHTPRGNHSRVGRPRSRDRGNGAAPLTYKQTEQVPGSISGQLDTAPAPSAQPVIPSTYLVPVVLQPAKLPQKSIEAAQAPKGSCLGEQAPLVEPVQSPQSDGGNGKSFETLLSEVMKRVQTPPDTSDAESEEHALTVEPLQAVHPYPSHSAPMPKRPQSYQSGKMTELLQAVQKNTREAQGFQVGEAMAGSRGHKTDIADDC